MIACFVPDSRETLKLSGSCSIAGEGGSALNGEAGSFRTTTTVAVNDGDREPSAVGDWQMHVHRSPLRFMAFSCSLPP